MFILGQGQTVEKSEVIDKYGNRPTQRKTKKIEEQQYRESGYNLTPPVFSKRHFK